MTIEQTNKGPEGQQGDEGVFPEVAFPPIGADVDNSAPPKDAAPKVDPVEERLAKMEEQFQQQQAQWAEREKRQQETIDKLLTGQIASAPAQPQTPPPDPYDMNDLPDPIERPKEFKAALAAKMRSVAEYNQQQAQQQSTQAGGMDALWTRFQTEHAELAKRPLLVQGAVAAEVGDLRARGVDPQRAAVLDPEGFVKRVASRMKAELGEESSTNTTDQSTITNKPNRTAGVSGGSHQAKPKGNAGGETTSFIEQMQKFQVADGLI